MQLAFSKMNDDSLLKIISLSLIYHTILTWAQHDNTCLRAVMTRHLLPQWVLMWQPSILLMVQVLENGGSHSDTHMSGKLRPRGRSLNTEGALGLTLHFLSLSLQQLFGLISSTVSCYITFSLKILLETLCQMPDMAI